MTYGILQIQKTIDPRCSYPGDLTVDGWCRAYVRHQLFTRLRIHPGEDCRSADITTIRERKLVKEALENLRRMGMNHIMYPV